MTTKKLAYLLVFSLFLGFSGVANATNEDTRYLCKSHSAFWEKSFSFRHKFNEGFTADLSDWQLRVARVFNVECIPVQKLNILPDAAADEAVDGIKARPGGGTSTRILPSDQIPWGIESIYNYDPSLTKTSGGASISVAVLDTGVLITHPDLKSRIGQCKDFTGMKLPVVNGKCDDKNGHGTHVSGVIAADGGADGKGIYGVAPQAKIFAYKVCGTNGSCWSDDIAFAITTAADEGADIISMSLGSDVESSLMRDAISYAVDKNVLVVAAAGNDGPDIGSIDYPGANPNVVAVGAFDVNLNIADWSSRGINSTTTPASASIDYSDIEFAAPGVVIESTWNDGGYVRLSGTSMATPHIAGLAARLWNRSVADPDSAIRNLLYKFSRDLGSAGEDDAYGFGFPHL